MNDIEQTKQDHNKLASKYNDSMSREDVIRYAALRLNITYEEARKYAVMFDILAELTLIKPRVYIYGLGKFEHVVHKAKRVRHPSTGEMMTMPERVSIKFVGTYSPNEMKHYLANQQSGDATGE